MAKMGQTKLIFDICFFFVYCCLVFGYFDICMAFLFFFSTFEHSFGIFCITFYDSFITMKQKNLTLENKQYL